MSSSSSFATAAATSSTSSTPLLPLSSEYSAPLAQALPYLKFALGFALDVAKGTWNISKQYIIPIPIILYIIAPFTVFLGYLASAFVFVPYATVVYLLEALHPLYVFCGVACLTGALLGAIGRLVAAGLIISVSPDREKTAKAKKDIGVVLKEEQRQARL